MGGEVRLSCWFRLPSVPSWERAWGSTAVLCGAAGWAVPSVGLQCMGFVWLVLGRANCKGLRWAGFAASRLLCVHAGLPLEALRRERALGFHLSPLKPPGRRSGSVSGWGLL